MSLMRLVLSSAAWWLVTAVPLAAAETVWRLNDPAMVGGRPVETWGKPLVVETLQGAALSFDGSDDGLLVPANPIAGSAAFTIEVLFNPSASGAEAQRFLHLDDGTGNRALLETRLEQDGRWCLDVYLRSGANDRAVIDRTKLHPPDRWYWVALRYDGARLTGFVNGEKQGEGEVSFAPLHGGRTSIGVRMTREFWFKGAIAEVRFSDAALADGALQRTK